MTLLNLRGIRESGSIFAVPTYLFLVGMIVHDRRSAWSRAAATVSSPQPPQVAGWRDRNGHADALGILLILTAFSRGCAALTGVEAISDGVPAFQPPEWKNARATLTVDDRDPGGDLLRHHLPGPPVRHRARWTPITPTATRRSSPRSRATIFGGGDAAYYYIQFATLAILILAANTAYSDFPRLSYFLARDRYLPRSSPSAATGWPTSTGIITLGILAALMLAGFGGETTRMIPLYAVGVFTAFTLSQGGMVGALAALEGAGLARRAWRSTSSA